MTKPIEIEIVGSDYTKLEAATFTILNLDQDQIEDPIKEYIQKEENQVAILQEFLEKMDKKGIVNTAVGLSKKDGEKKKLWTYFGDNPYFDGVVGVMQSELVVVVECGELKLFSNRNEFKKHKENYSDYIDEELTLKIRLQIKSRFDTVKPYFLATMLLRNNLKLNDNMVLSSEDDLYDYLLLFWFKTKLEEAISKGFFKTYRRFEANNERLKGAIDISRHIRLNAGQSNGKIAYSYRENTINNYLNHLIIAAYDYLKKKYPELVEDNFDSDPDMKGSIDGLRCAIGYDPIESKMLIAKNNKPISHPYFMEYEDLRIICIKILRDEGISIWDAENDETKSILFYIPDLWELYLEDKLKEKLGNDVYTQGKLPDGNNIEIFGNFSDEGVKFTKVYPDFVFFDDEDPYMVLDAKFKKSWGEFILDGKQSTLGYNLSDYDKCIRDMNSTNTHATGVIFPTDILPSNSSEYFEEKYLSHKISKYNDSDRFYTFPISVLETDGSTKYTDWKNEFDECIDKALSSIKSKAVIEKAFAKEIRDYMQNFPNFPKRANE